MFCFNSNESHVLLLPGPFIGSCFEVGLSHRRRKQIMLNLGRPVEEMFFRMEQNIDRALTAHLEGFYQSRFFFGLLDDIKAARESERLKLKSKSTCVGLASSLSYVPSMLPYSSSSMLNIMPSMPSMFNNRNKEYKK